MSRSEWIELDRQTREVHRSARNFAQISANGPPPERWHRRWVDHSLLHAFDVWKPESGDRFARFVMVVLPFACGAFAFHLAKWLLASLHYAILYPIAAIFVLSGDAEGTPQFIQFVKSWCFVSPAFCADSLEKRIVWAASFYVLKDALEYLPESLKQSRVMPDAFDITVIISSLWTLDRYDHRNKMLAWKCIESPRPLTVDNIDDTVNLFAEYHIKMSSSVGMLLASSGVVASRALIGAIALARLLTASDDDAEMEMMASRRVKMKEREKWKEKNDLSRDMVLNTMRCCAQISAAEARPNAWYKRWKDHTILHIYRRFPTDGSVVMGKYSFGIGVVSASLVFYVMKWLFSKMIAYLPTTMMYFIAAIFILLKAKSLLIHVIPVFGCYRLENRLCWAAAFIAAYDALTLLPESLNLSEIQLLRVVMFVSGVWSIDRGDYYCKKLSWECARQKRSNRSHDETAGILYEFTEYINLISSGVGIALGSCGLVSFSLASAGFLVSFGAFIILCT